VALPMQHFVALSQVWMLRTLGMMRIVMGRIVMGRIVMT